MFRKGLPKSGTGTLGRGSRDASSGTLDAGTRGSDIGDVNKTYRCS